MISRNGQATAFGDLLRQLRQSHRLSQTGLSNLTGIKPSYVSRLEAGSRQPSREMVDRIIIALALAGDERMALLSAAFLPPDVVAVPASR